MNVILRPLMPPSALTLSKYAASVLPITPYEEAGPLYGMILPIFISVSLAPGSYFLCAFAAVIAAAAASAASAIRLRIQAGIVLSRSTYFVQVSQVSLVLASIGLSRGAKRHCCAPPIMVSSPQRTNPSRQTACASQLYGSDLGIPGSQMQRIASRAGSASRRWRVAVFIGSAAKSRAGRLR